MPRQPDHEAIGQAWRLFRQGKSQEEIGEAVGRSVRQVQNYLDPRWLEKRGIGYLSEIGDEKELRGLLIRWLELEEQVTLRAWIQIITDNLASSAGILDFARTMSGLPSGDDTNRQALSPYQVREALLESYAPQFAFQHHLRSSGHRNLHLYGCAWKMTHFGNNTGWQKRR